MVYYILFKIKFFVGPHPGDNAPFCQLFGYLRNPGEIHIIAIIRQKPAHGYLLINIFISKFHTFKRSIIISICITKLKPPQWS